MRREDDMEQGRVITQERFALRRLTKREIDRRIAAIGEEVAQAFKNVQSERVEYLGQAIFPIPVDNKTFIRIVSRYTSLN